jgi:hypothetical protein
VLSAARAARVVARTVGEPRGNRYDAAQRDARGDGSAHALKVWGLSPELGILAGTVGAAGLGVITGLIGIRRQGILGREPSGDTEFQEGDIVVIYGTPAALEHAEAVLLAG